VAAGTATAADAAGLLLSAVRDPGPVVFLDHKLLSAGWRDWLGGEGRPGVQFDVPQDGAVGAVPDPVAAVPIGVATLRRDGTDVALISLGLGVHRALAAADELAGSGIEAAVLDLRSVAPLDSERIIELGRRTGRVVVIDEDYRRSGLSGEVAALLAEGDVPARFARVTVESTIPFAPHREAEVLPSVDRILQAVKSLG
jgi:pyruvate dehydrogenase E1 component beta subunit